MILPRDSSPDPDPENPPFQIYLDSLNEFLMQESDRHNSMPDPGMGGLSPEQVHNLLYSPWGEPGCLIQFNHELDLALLNTSPFFRQARMLLQAVVEAGGVKATATGKCLNRRFVEGLVPRMFDGKTKKRVWDLSKKLDELDVWDLHIARVVCELAKLIRLQKTTFAVPKSKQGILADQAVGPLFKLLFLTYYRKFSLGYLIAYGPHVERVQSCMGYSLYRMGVVASDWVPVEDLPKLIFLPAVIKEITAVLEGYSYHSLNDVVESHALKPLIDWGFLEATHKPSPYEYCDDDLERVRITPLYRAFFRFGINH